MKRAFQWRRPWALLVCLLAAASAGAGAQIRGGRAARAARLDPQALGRWRFVGPARVAGLGAGRVVAASGFSAAVWDAGALAGDFTITFRYQHGRGVGDVVLSPKGPELPEALDHVLIRDDGVVLVRRRGGGRQERKAAPHAFVPGQWYAMAIKRSGGQLQLLVGGAPVLTVADPRPVSAGQVAFGSLAGDGFSFADIAVAGAAGPGVALARPALKAGRVVYGTLDDRSLSEWRLAPGARFTRRGREGRRLDVVGAAEAAWAGVAAKDYTVAFRCRFERGGGQVALQRSGTGRGRREYQLEFDTGRMALTRLDGGRRQVLGVAAVRLAPGEWHDVGVYSSRGWMRISLDNAEVLKVQDPLPLPPGEMAFRSMGGGRKVAYAQIRFTPWTAAQGATIRKILEREAARPKLLTPKPPKSNLPRHVVPLQVAVYQHPDQYTKQARRINPGDIPPNFVHTWILDLKDIDTFKLHFESPGDVQLHPGDRITVHNADSLKSKKPLAIINATAKESELIVDVSKAKYDHTWRGTKYRRIFLQLETSNATPPKPRRFVLSGLAVAAPKKGTEEALVFADALDYQAGKITRGRNEQGAVVPISAPWKAGEDTNYNSYPLPDLTKGWYLIAQNVTQPVPLFYTLVYYNEQRGLLRLYLKNRAMPTNVSGATATVSLIRFAKKTIDGTPTVVPQKLDGAFFPLHPNATRWSSATVPLVEWKRGSWACVQIPMLYPMGENIPIDTALASRQPQHYYRSLYEEPLQKGFRNIQLEVLVESYDYGDLKGTWVGKAVGDAIQKMGKGGGSNASIDFAKTIAKAFATGKDMYDGARKMYNGMKGFYDANKGTGAGSAGWGNLKSFMSMGASVFSGGAGMAGAVLSFISFFSGGNKVEPLQLSIELDLQGVLHGTLWIKHKLGSFSRFYLPGRFSIQEAFDAGLDVYAPNVMAAVTPRYDRTLGLFGYRFHPRYVTFPLTQSFADDTYKKKSQSMIYPAGPYPVVAGASYAKHLPKQLRLARMDLDEWLPIIYNPFAEITPARPLVVKTETYTSGPGWPGPPTYYRWSFDLSWKTHVKPEAGDKTFPTNTLHDHQYGPNLFVRVFHHADALTNVRPFYSSDPAFLGKGVHAKYMEDESTYKQSPTMLDTKGRVIQIAPEKRQVPQARGVFNRITHVAVKSFYSASMGRIEPSWMKESLDPKHPYPVDSVVYYWDVPYFYYARTRQRADGSVPRAFKVAHLSSPVTLLVSQFDVESKPGTNDVNYKFKKQDKAPSTLLRP